MELYDRAIGNELRTRLAHGRRGYGSKPESLRELTTRQQRYRRGTADLHWLAQAAWVITRPFHRNARGQGRRIPRLASGSPPARRVGDLLYPSGRTILGGPASLTPDTA